MKKKYGCKFAEFLPLVEDYVVTDPDRPRDYLVRNIETEKTALWWDTGKRPPGIMLWKHSLYTLC